MITAIIVGICIAAVILFGICGVCACVLSSRISRQEEEQWGIRK